MSNNEKSLAKAREWAGKVQDHYNEEDPDPWIADVRDGYDHLAVALTEIARLEKKLVAMTGNVNRLRASASTLLRRIESANTVNPILVPPDVNMALGELEAALAEQGTLLSPPYTMELTRAVNILLWQYFGMTAAEATFEADTYGGPALPSEVTNSSGAVLVDTPFTRGFLAWVANESG